MVKSKLIAIGCSYTEHYLNSMHTEIKLDFMRWPQILANKLDMKCHNLGLCGVGHEYMISKLLDVIMFEKNIGLIVIMWSEWQRMDFEHENCWQRLMPQRDNSKVEPWPLDTDARTALLNYNNTCAATMYSVRKFLTAQELMRDIPYLMIQGCNPLVDPLFLHPKSDEVIWQNVHRKRKLAIKKIINSSITDKINESKFIGWPIFEDIGGYYLDNILDELDPDRIKLRVDENDSHPNGEGHEYIAKMLHDKYEEIYS